MLHNFIDREREWKFLEETFGERKAQLVVFYGRRRVGKSFLTSQFINEKKGIYCLCTKGNEKEQLELLSEKLCNHFGDESLRTRPFAKWGDFFSYIAQKAKKERIAIEFDEFPYLVTANSAIPSIFQKYWDEELSQTSAYMILCGSSIGMMEREVLAYKSPLYGRRTGQWKLTPLPFKHVMEFFKESDEMENMIETYSVTGGMPFYLVSLDLKKSAVENILLNIARKGKPLLEEGELLVKEELSEPTTYFSILHAIANGQTKQSDIANHVGMPATGLVRYLSNLQQLGFVNKKTPVTEKSSSKKSLYFIGDNFLAFWFKFIYANKSYIEEENSTKINELMKNQFTPYVGKVFEQVCTQALQELRKNGEIEFNAIGNWWGPYLDKATGERKTAEIDVVAIDKEGKGIIFAECKWQKNADATQLLSDLKQKTQTVNWNAENRKEQYFLFAKSFKEKKLEGATLIDLNILRKIFKGKPN